MWWNSRAGVTPEVVFEYNSGAPHVSVSVSKSSYDIWKMIIMIYWKANLQHDLLRKHWKSTQPFLSWKSWGIITIFSLCVSQERNTRPAVCTLWFPVGANLPKLFSVSVWHESSWCRITLFPFKSCIKRWWNVTWQSAIYFGVTLGHWWWAVIQRNRGLFVSRFVFLFFLPGSAV